MILDGETRLSDAQSLSASGATTNYYDQGLDHDLGRGEPMAMVFTITTAADTADGNETYSFAAQTDDNTSFSSATDMIERSMAGADLEVGAQVVLPLPPEAERYVRGYVTLGGTTPSVSFDCDIMPLSMARRDHDVHYASGFSVS